jgi:hypothetical protein
MTRRVPSILIALPGLCALALVLRDPTKIQLAILTIPVILLSWIGIARRYTIGALCALVFVFMTANVRLGVARMGVDNAGGIRGWLYLGDVLSFGLVLATLFKRSVVRRRPHRFATLPIVLMMPYVLLSMALPVCGVAAHELPPSYALPAVRGIQWLSLAYVAYSVAQQRGVSVARSLSRTIMAVAVPHGVYALLQLGYYQFGVVPSALLAWDDQYVTHNFAGVTDNSWFGWRATGLQVNPNLYGLIASLVMVAILAATLVDSRKSRVLAYVSSMACIAGILLSGSRTAVVMLIAASIGGTAVLVRRRGSLRNWSLAIGVIVVCIVVTGSVGTLWNGTYLSSRFGDALLSLDGLRMDKTVLARQEVWDELASSVQNYPLGTWAPPGYMFRYAVDSMYVQTAVQGTVFYTATLIVFAIGAILLGWRCFTANRKGPAAWSGLCLAGWSLAAGIASISMGAFNNGEVCVPFAALCGCTLALSGGARVGALLLRGRLYTLSNDRTPTCSRA